MVSYKNRNIGKGMAIRPSRCKAPLAPNASQSAWVQTDHRAAQPPSPNNSLITPLFVTGLFFFLKTISKYAIVSASDFIGIITLKNRYEAFEATYLDSTVQINTNNLLRRHSIVKLEMRYDFFFRSNSNLFI